MPIHGCAVCKYGGEAVEKANGDVFARCQILSYHRDLATMSEEQFRLIAKDCLTGGIYEIAEAC